MTLPSDEGNGCFKVVLLLLFVLMLGVCSELLRSGQAP
jgi:hypothetical protein